MGAKDSEERGGNLISGGLVTGVVRMVLMYCEGVGCSRGRGV